MNQNNDFIETMRKLNDIEASRRILTLAIYNKKLEDIKQRKLTFIKNELESRLYDCSRREKEMKKTEIDELLKQYEEEISQTIDIYNMQQLKLQKHLQESEIMQKYLIEDILKSYKEFDSMDTMLQEQKDIILNKLKNKLNYDVIIEECEARIEFYTDKAISTLEEIFIEQKELVNIQKENFITRFFKILKTFFSTSKQSDILQTAKNKLNEIRNKLEKIKINAKCEIYAFDIQMENVKVQIK